MKAITDFLKRSKKADPVDIILNKGNGADYTIIKFKVYLTRQLSIKDDICIFGKAKIV